MVALDFTIQRALAPAGIVITVDNGIRLGRGAALRVQQGEIAKGPVRFRQFVDFVAAFFAFATANAPRVVKQHAVALGITAKGLV